MEDKEEKATIGMLAKIIATIMLRNHDKLTISQKEITAAENKTFIISQDKNNLDLNFEFQENEKK